VKKDVPPMLARDVLRAAEMNWLARQPLCNPDRLGRYASLYLENCPGNAVILCLMDEKYRLIAVHCLASGPRAELARYGPLIPDLFRSSGAAHAAVCFHPRAGGCGFTGEDDRTAVRLAAYCRQQGISLIECVVAWTNGYVPLFHLFDFKP